MHTHKLTARPFAQVAAAIEALDLESVKLRLMDPDLGKGWTRDYAEHVESAYKTYLTLAAKYQDNAEEILLAKDVDEFWHTHILQTMKYAADCRNVFGTFLHHDPHVGKITPELREKRARLAAKTRSLYEREFGSTARAEAAWTGRADSASAAMSNISIRSESAAMSNIAMRAEAAAMSNIEIQAEAAAMSNIAIDADDAAMSNIAIHPDLAAMSNIAIHPDNAAMSNIALQAAAATA